MKFIPKSNIRQIKLGLYVLFVAGLIANYVFRETDHYGLSAKIAAIVLFLLIFLFAFSVYKQTLRQ